VTGAAFRDCSVLVTGGTGFLGGHLVRRLVALGARVHILARPRSSPERIADVLPSVKILAGDIRARRSVAAAVAAAEPEYVFHLAAYGVDPRRRDPTTIVATNVVGLVHLLAALRAVPYRRLVNTGTCFEYGNRRAPIPETAPVDPLNVYAASKVMALHLCRLHAAQHGENIVTLRPFTFYGPGERADRLIPAVIGAIIAGRPIRITAGRQTRDYTYVEDMAAAFVSAAVAPGAAGQVLNVGTGRDLPVRAIAERIRQILESSVPLEIGTVPTRADDAWRLCADARKARALLRWRPRVVFEEGVRRTAAWLRAQAPSRR